MPNCSNMPSISTHAVVADQWHYENNERIALLAERLGFRYLFPVSRWRGFGGTTNFLGTSLETNTWAAALLRATRSIRVFSTVHVPLFHPVVMAKIGATLAHMSGDRWGLNVVSGWSEREFGMMGITLAEHSRRYERTGAFVDILRKLWDPGQAPLDHHSEWYTITAGVSLPRPARMPEIANAGVSADARAMTTEYCDWSFMSGASIEALPALVNSVHADAERVQPYFPSRYGGIPSHRRRTSWPESSTTKTRRPPATGCGRSVQAAAPSTPSPRICWLPAAVV